MKSYCAACRRFDEVDVDHIKTRGSGGPNESFNEWYLCRPCHRKKHDKGMAHMINLFPHLSQELKSRGWTTEIVLGRFRLWHPRICGIQTRS